MKDASDRGAPSNLRGWLSEVYLPALVASQTEQLVHRLGARASIDDPVFGRTTGMSGLVGYLDGAAAWLTKRNGAFERLAFTTGSDRDVTEGLLSLSIDGKRVSVPIGIVAERRPEREVAIRLYYATKLVLGSSTKRAPLVPRENELALPPPIDAYLEALARGDVDAVVATFENGATLCDPSGKTYTKTGQADGMRAFFEALFTTDHAATVPDQAGGQPRSDGGRGVTMVKGARADDGRTCALEYTVTKMRGTDVAPWPGLAVYERGESGLLRTTRLYHDD